MTKKTRLIILLTCVICFLAITPLLILYSMGDRFDFKKMNITATGGIYVRTFPTADQITIDSKITEKPGLFSSSIFVQSLLPDNHTISIDKTGYYNYFKTLPVVENQVTKLENVLLLKKAIAFGDFGYKIDYFSTSPNNQNTITATAGAKGIALNYFSLNSTNPPQPFSITQTGKVSNISWSDDSSRALIKIQNSSNVYYYLFDSPSFTQTTSKKPITTRLLFLDKTSQQISFSPQDSQTIFYIKNNTLYSTTGNNSLTIIKNIISYRISGSDITWLSAKGTLFNSNLAGKLENTVSSKNFSIDTQKKYEVLSILGNTFLKEDNTLFKLNPDTKIFENYSTPATNSTILTSPDNKNLLYWSNNQIYLYSLADKKNYKLFTGEQINNCRWLNNDYIIFTSGDKIIISEIDYRGNINAVTLPQKVAISPDKTIEIKNPEMFFNSQDAKIYILTGNALIVSEKIIP